MKKNFIYFSLPLLGALTLASCSEDDNITTDPVTNPDDTVVLEDSTPSPVIDAEGFFVVNEDWFGHDNGTVNYFKNNGEIIYRAYRAANEGETFGVTTQFATIYGNNAYFVSKQGNRLVVADAKTMKKKAVLKEIGGDGRSFVGVTPQKGYIATAKGISIFNIETLSLEGTIAEVSGETGNMQLVGNYVFAVTKGKGVYVINTQTDAVEKLIDNTAAQMVTQSKDGSVWIAANQTLVQIDPFTLETINEISIADAPAKGNAFAWNAGSFAASTQENVLYWTNGTSVVQYNIDTQTLNPTLYTLGNDDEGKTLAFYGGALRVDPLTNHIVLTVTRSGFGESSSYNWLHIIDNNGGLIKNIVVNGDNGLGSDWGTESDRYFWFPAMPFFEDANAPEILLNQVIVAPNERKAIALNEKIVDADNISASIIKGINAEESEFATYEIKQDSLIVTAKDVPGKDKLTLSAVSNGKSVSKEIRIDVRIAE